MKDQVLGIENDGLKMQDHQQGSKMQDQKYEEPCRNVITGKMDSLLYVHANLHPSQDSDT